MAKRRIAQVVLLNVAVALLIAPLTSTLNRIMITELSLSATLVGFLIALRFIASPLRIWFGRLSDRRPIAGRHRVPYIILGVTLGLTGFVLAPHAAFAIPNGGAGGIVFALFAFTLIGLGINMTTPLYFAIVSDQSREEERPRIAALMFIVLGVVAVVNAALISAYLEDYSDAKLFNVFYVVAGIVAVLALVSLIGLEEIRSAGQVGASAEAETLNFGQVRALLTRNPDVLRFFIFLVLTFIAIDAQEIVLEPYGALAFGMTPDETTRLTAIERSGNLVALIIGFFTVNRLGFRRSIYLGIGLALVAFVAIIGAGVSGIRGPFMGGVVLLGLGNGFVTLTSLSLMFNMTTDAEAGVYLGTWGFAQGFGVGVATVLGGILRDAGAAVFGAQLPGYFTTFGFEIVVLLLALPLIGRISVARFRTTGRELASVSGD